MAFARLAYRESLRDTEVRLATRPNKLYQIGFRQLVRRARLADADATATSGSMPSSPSD